MPDWDKALFDRFYGPMSCEPWGAPGLSVRPPIRLNYHWRVRLKDQAEVYAAKLAAAIGANPGDAIVLVGCGFNGTGAGLTALGYRVIGTEISSYILNNAALTEETDCRAAISAVGLNPDTYTITDPNCVNFGASVGQLMLDYMLDGGLTNTQPRGKGVILGEDLRVKGSRNRIINEFNSRWPGVTPRFIITEEVLNSIDDNEAGLVCSYCAAGASEWGSTVVHALSPRMPGHAQDPLLNWKTYAAWRSLLDANGYSAQLIMPTVTGRQQGMVFPIEAEAYAYYLAQGVSEADATNMAAQHVSEQQVIAYQGVF